MVRTFPMWDAPCQVSCIICLEFVKSLHQAGSHTDWSQINSPVNYNCPECRVWDWIFSQQNKNLWQQTHKKMLDLILINDEIHPSLHILDTCEMRRVTTVRNPFPVTMVSEPEPEPKQWQLYPHHRVPGKSAIRHVDNFPIFKTVIL